MNLNLKQTFEEDFYETDDDQDPGIPWKDRKLTTWDR